MRARVKETGEILNMVDVFEEVHGQIYTYIDTEHNTIYKAENLEILGLADLDEEPAAEKTENMLMEKKVFDYYQERSTTAGSRADQLAWMFIVMMTGVLISGHTYQTFAECAALSAIYMLLSVMQAVWQTFTSWLFMKQIRKADVMPNDYPAWVGCGAWLFFWLKMISISAAVCYFVYVIFS